MNRESLPIRKISGNLVFTSEDVWACFKVRCRSYRAEPARRRAALVNELTEYARSAQADFQIIRVSRYFDPATYVKRLRDRLPADVHEDLWHGYLDNQKRILDGLDAWTPVVFVCVRLSDPGMDFQSRASRLFEQTPREIARGMWGRVSGPRTTSSQDVEERAQVAQSRIHIRLDTQPATYAELQWLIRRSFCRGLVEPDESLEEPGDSERAVKRWFGENGIERSYRHLRAVGDFGESYQAGLCLGEMGHAQPFTRQVELMFSALEEYPWPIDASLNVRYVTNEQARRRVYNQHARKSVQLAEETEATHGAMGEAHERVALSRELYDRLSATGEPVLEGSLSFIVSAGDEREMGRRARLLKDGFPWPLYRPYGDQLDLWKQHLPGQPPLVRGYDRPFTTEQIGSMVPHGTHEAGSTNGRSLYVAKTLHGKQPVFFDLREASGTDKPPTIALLGTLGGGKTVFLQLLQYQGFLQGARIVDIDPKGDHRFHLLPEVAPFVRTIELGPSPEHAGKLDPLRVAPVAERHDAAATFLIDVLPPVDAAVQAAISGSISRVLERHGDRACCVEVIKDLEGGEREEEQRAGYLLRQYCEAGIVRLGFAKLDDPLPDRATEQVVYLNVRALKRAGIETVRSEMSQSQRHGRAVLQLVALFAMKILGEERDQLKLLSFDEASFLTEDALGQQLLDTLARWGRSELAIPILSTQLLGDVADQDNLIGHWFLFAMKSHDHAIRALETLELDSTGPLVTALTERYRGGRALYRDLHGRCEEIQVDLGDDGLLEGLSTTPVEKVA